MCKNAKFVFSYVTGVCEHELQDINVTDDEKLKLILKSWGCTDFYDILIGNFLFNIPKNNDYNLILIDVAEKLNYDNLQFLQESDYLMLSRNLKASIGDLINFRNGHGEWKNRAVGLVSITNKTCDCTYT